jgi:hypothetical protein
MSTFLTFLELGFDHILDLDGYDHILFVLALCAVYSIYESKQVLILVTAFTIGHSITLALAVFNIVLIDSSLVELLIIVTIFATALSNLFKSHQAISKNKIRSNYAIALFFGLIHGLGFSTYLKALLGRNSDIVGQLFGFNIGLEIGQLVIVLTFMIISFIATHFFKVNKRDWKLMISSAIAGISLMLLYESAYWTS